MKHLYQRQTQLRGMSTTEKIPAFFKSSPARPRQKFCGVFCPVEGSSDSKSLDFDSLSACRGRRNDHVIDRQTDISLPKKVEIWDITGKEALQNLDDIRVIFFRFAPSYVCLFIFGAVLRISLPSCVANCNNLHKTPTKLIVSNQLVFRESASHLIQASFAHVSRPSCCNYVSHKALWYKRVHKRSTMPTEGVVAFNLAHMFSIELIMLTVSFDPRITA